MNTALPQPKNLLFVLLLASFHTQAQVHLGINQPYPNIQAAANANAIQPGDTVYMHAGLFTGYQFITNLNGSPNHWIVIRAYQPNTISISGTWQFVSCRYLKFEQLTFKGTAAEPGRLFTVDNGGSCNTASRHIIVDHCSFTNVTSPTAIAAFKLAGVDSFEVTNCLFKDFPACSGMDFNACSEGLIRGNRIENCQTGGHIKGGGSNITMEQNLFINASSPTWVAYELGGDTGAQFYCPEDDFEVKNLKFYSNIIVGGYRGLALSSARDCQVRNNTFYQCGQATLRFLTTSTLYPTLSGNIVENNLLAFGTSAYINGGPQPAGAASFSHNIYQSTEQSTFNGPYWDTPDLDAIKDPNPMNFGSTVPMFINASAGDYRLEVGSPAIGSGTLATEPALDFWGQPFSATARSIGAIESPEKVGTKAPFTTQTMRLFPNPATDFIEISGVDFEEKILIFNALGILVLRTENTHPINVSSLVHGLYVLKAGTRSGKFLKQ